MAGELTRRTGIQRYPIIQGISYDDYVRLPGLRFSDAKGFRRTPLHARYEMLNPKDDTPSTLLGTAVHTSVLEPKKFLARYAVAPKLDKRTKIGKAMWAEFEGDHPTVICLTEEEGNAVLGMTGAIAMHPFMATLLSLPSMREVVFEWDEQVSEYPQLVQHCKCRVDLIAKPRETVMLCIKTTRDASDEAFSRSVNTYAYHAQAASYLRGAQAVKPMQSERRFIWCAVENKPPYGVKLHEPSGGALVQGTNEYLSWVKQFALAQHVDSWPGYDEGISMLDLPRYAQQALTGEVS